VFVVLCCTFRDMTEVRVRAQSNGAEAALAVQSHVEYHDDARVTAGSHFEKVSHYLVRVGGTLSIRCIGPADCVIATISAIPYSLTSETTDATRVHYTFGPFERVYAESKHTSPETRIEHLLALLDARTALERWVLAGKPTNALLMIPRHTVGTVRARFVAYSFSEVGEAPLLPGAEVRKPEEALIMLRLGVRPKQPSATSSKLEPPPLRLLPAIPGSPDEETEVKLEGEEEAPPLPPWAKRKRVIEVIN
jgi:hypothetical protein